MKEANLKKPRVILLRTPVSGLSGEGKTVDTVSRSAVVRDSGWARGGMNR